MVMASPPIYSTLIPWIKIVKISKYIGLKGYYLLNYLKGN
jgi:hypothetical protein